MSQPTHNAGATPDEVLNALDALGEDPNACRVDAVHSRLAGLALPAGDRESVIRQAVDTARHQVDAQGALREDNQHASREVLERAQEKSFEVADIKFSAVRKMKPIPHWLLRIDETGEVLESGAGGISNVSVPKMITSVEELFSRVSKSDVADFRRRFGLRALSPQPNQVEVGEAGRPPAQKGRAAMAEAIAALQVASVSGGELDLPMYENAYRSLCALQDTVLAYDRRLTELEMVPTGDDYNELFRLIGAEAPSKRTASDLVHEVTPNGVVTEDPSMGM